MRFNVEVRVSYRNREMPEDTALALAAIHAYVEKLSREALDWCVAAIRELGTPAAARWKTVLSTADRIARGAATVGWADPHTAEIQISILPKTPLDDAREWGGHSAAHLEAIAFEDAKVSAGAVVRRRHAKNAWQI